MAPYSDHLSSRSRAETALGVVESHPAAETALQLSETAFAGVFLAEAGTAQAQLVAVAVIQIAVAVGTEAVSPHYRIEHQD